MIDDLEELAKVALEAARDAATLLQAGWRTRPDVAKKGEIELVTSFDVESERLLRTRLAPTRFACIGEEQGGECRADAPAWYVDPLDGTTNFVHGHPFFCVSVGLLLGSRPLLGVVVAPALATEWVGVAPSDARPGFATRNGVPCEVSGVTTFDDALLATGFPYDRRTSPDNNFDAFVAIKKRAQGVRRCGSAALDLCLVADGTYDGYWERKLKPWDLAAGAAIVLGSGGRISAFDGSPADVASGRLIATNGRVHEELVRTLGEAE